MSKVPAGVTNFIRLKLARLQAELSRNMYSEQGLDALMRPVFLRGVPAVDGGVVLHAGIAALPGGFGDLVHEVAGLVGLDRLAVLDGAGGEVAVRLEARMNSSLTRTELLAFWKKMEREGFGVGAGAVVAGCDEGVGLGFFLGLALDEVDDVGMVDVEDDHLGGAAGLAAGLDDAGEGIEAAHEAERAAGGAAAGERLPIEPRMLERLVPVPDPHLKSMPSVLARVRMESSESSTELMKQAEHCGLR